MSDDMLDRFDDYDGPATCPQCGSRMVRDSDGDGVMTMSVDLCENCGFADRGEPVRITEEMFRFARENGLMEN